MTNFRLSFADDNFKYDENGRKLSKWVEAFAENKSQAVQTRAVT